MRLHHVRAFPAQYAESAKMSEIHQRERSGMNQIRFLTTGQVAKLFEVSPSTVARWAREGKLPVITTPSGRRKFPRETIERLAGYRIEELTRS